MPCRASVDASSVHHVSLNAWYDDFMVESSIGLELTHNDRLTIMAQDVTRARIQRQ